MHDDRNRTDETPLNDSLSLIEGVQALQGEELPEDQDAVLTADEVEGPREYTRTELDQGDALRDPAYVADPPTSYDGGAIEGMREGETSDAGVATQEGLTWVPPIDPPVTLDGDDAADGGDITDLIHEALRADATTTELSDQLVVAVIGRRAHVRGTVLTVDDSDAIVAVIERVEGIDEVIDETVLAETTN